MPQHPSHPIAVASGSRLRVALGERAVVNSYHHQAVARLGRDAEAVAFADDGIVEAIELPAFEFALGVQWELQESWKDDPGCFAIFEAFVAAARRRSAAQPPSARWSSAAASSSAGSTAARRSAVSRAAGP
jgi:putative glutamine amidotransferase